VRADEELTAFPQLETNLSSANETFVLRVALSLLTRDESIF
jgi:hypothetical protein